jgi:hypothetical protein
MIPEEQTLADETTPMLDGAYAKIGKLLKKLESGDIADLPAWRHDTLLPALHDGSAIGSMRRRAAAKTAC